MTTNRKLQIGVMGSMADLQYSTTIEKLAGEVGFEIAKRGAVLMFGAEKDFDSLSTAACRGAKCGGGFTVGFTYGKGLEIYEKNYVDVVIATGLERGGGREFSLVLSCDAIICLSGGSGTLTEITIAYQANIPIIALKNTGGWSEKLANKFLDDRQRVRIQLAATPKDAVARAICSIARHTLFVGATHGNETIGVKILKRLEREKIINEDDWIVGNPKALDKGKRYIESDLNRVFPGSNSGVTYEERRAAEIMERAQTYRYAVDIHGTNDNTRIFIIVSNPTVENIAMAECFDIPRIVLWPSTSSRITGSFNQFVQCGIEIECGPQNNKKIQQELIRVLSQYVRGTKPSQLKQYFQVYGKLKQYKGARGFKSFQKVEVNNEQFYPLLVDRYPGIKCHKMKQIDPPR